MYYGDTASVQNHDRQPLDEGNKTFPIVGIGASAGGLEAFKRLLSNLPSDSGMGIVFIQHLSPTHESQLSEILSGSTEMPVVEAENGASVQPNHVYVIPPNADLAILNGLLNVMPRAEAKERHMAIDYFFRSLAQDRGRQAIGVLLSGSNSDGALGLQAIKAEGGITLAQDEQSAQYSTMPRSAINVGAVDFVLSPEHIAAELARIGQHPYVSRSKPQVEEAVVDRDGDELKKIFVLLRTQTGVDFTFYKQTTIRRRLMRRLALHKIAGLRDYLKYLQEHPAELNALYDDMLINVTSFFRDRDTFEALKYRVFPKLTANRSPEAPIRVWAAGCATGEEAYSLAISLVEYLGEKADKTPIQIFTTDISDKVIDRARTGIYPENISLDVSPSRLKRFFAKVEMGYQISKAIRDICVFSRQNLIKDPPFSKLDLISCRNVLIYMDGALQERVIPIFHYALNPGGFLVLGTAESTGRYSDLFSIEDRKHKIYSRTPVESHRDFGFVLPVRPDDTRSTVQAGGDETRRHFNLQKESERIILNKYGPVGVVIDAHMEIILFRGHTGLFLESPPGEVSLNIFAMARDGLMPGLRSAIFEARNRDIPVTRADLRIRSNDKLKRVTVHIHPMTGPSPTDTHFLVLFDDMGYVEPLEGKKKPGKQRKQAQGSEEDGESVYLKEELTATKEYLESVNSQYQATNEELKSANEEIQSSNEELHQRGAGNSQGRAAGNKRRALDR
jgi:two-component system CheB/CheR fusion protein